MSKLSPNEILNVLNTRRDLLVKLRGGITNKRELTGKLQYSRPTIDRAFRNLEDLGIISSDGTDYELTLFGMLVTDEFEKSWSAVEQFISVREFLMRISPHQDIPLELVNSGTIYPSEPRAPAEPFHQVVDLLEGSQQFLAILSVLKPEYIQCFHEAITQHGISGSLIFHNIVLDTLYSNYRNELTDLLNSKRCALEVTNQSSPFNLIIVDEEVLWAGFYGPTGGLHGAIVNSSEDMIQWGLTFFESFRDRSEQVTLRGGYRRCCNHQYRSMRSSLKSTTTSDV